MSPQYDSLKFFKTINKTINKADFPFQLSFVAFGTTFLKRDMSILIRLSFSPDSSIFQLQPQTCCRKRRMPPKEIRQLEEKRVVALLKKDTAALVRIYSPNYVVNRPLGILSTRDNTVERIVADPLNFISYRLEMEKLIIKNNLVITMGSETVGTWRKKS